MILLFPDIDTLHLALSSGAVPPNVSQAAAQAGFEDKGAIWLQPSVAPSKSALADLRKLRVQTPRNCSVPLDQQFCCWLQIFPVQPSGDRLVPPEQTPVLFDLPAEQFAGVVTEILRLGNDRQSFRYLEDSKGQASRVLLRVVGPPYYSLLRALDREGSAVAPIAYVEAAPRVWIQLGHTHPFLHQVKVPPGRLLLLQPPQQWTFLADTPFREVYDVLEFVLPEGKTAYDDHDLQAHLKVPLRLTTGDPSEVDELWVLRDRPLEQLDDLVSNAQDELLQQLSFAVAEKDGKRLIVVRLRPSRREPPQLVLDAVAFRTYQKLPNLFVPSGKRLHPPLSRHKLRQLLADDPAVLTWLYPGADGAFTPESLPDDAFRPLTDWIDYVLDHDRQALQTWMQATQFDFEPFVCSEEQSARPKKPPGGERDKKSRKQAAAEGGDLDDLQPFVVPNSREQQAPELEEDISDFLAAEPDALDERRRALEESFLRVDGPIDHPERQTLWPELAAVYAAQGHHEDAGLSWVNAIWGADTVPPAWAWNWFRVEASRVPARDERGRQRERSWASSASLAVGNRREIEAADLDRVLALEEPTSADINALAAYLFWSATRPQPSPALVERLGRVGHFLETHERYLPVRAAWLAQAALAQLSGGDVLGLARTRDRLLERLFQQGLRPEQDLPPFLRFAGQSNSDRMRGFRNWMIGLSDTAHRWVQKLGQDSALQATATTEPYVDLIFGFGLARLGEADTARALQHRAAEDLGNRDDVHQFLLQAYSYRIQQVLEGKRPTGPLPAEQMEYLEQMERMQRYVVDRLRQHSRILEPDQKIDPYREWGARRSDLERALAELPDISDRKELAARVEQLLKQVPKDKTGPEVRARILRAALDLAPRVSEDFSLRLLVLVGPAYDDLPESRDEAGLLEQASLLEKGMFVAGHFDRLEHVKALIDRFQKLLQGQKGVSTVQGLDKLAEECFHGLRKLGMKDEIDLLLRQMRDLILESQGVKSLPELLHHATGEGMQKKDSRWLSAFAALLHVAGGWYYFGQNAEAESVLDAARTLLYGKALLDPKLSLATRQTDLARAYAATLGQAPVEIAQKRLDELFHRLEVRDSYTTNSHYKLSQLDVLEAVVRAVVSDDLSMGSDVRRWLDEDEFLVRRRIHRDLRALVARAEA